MRPPIDVSYVHRSSADVAELADAPDLGSGTARGEGSNPSVRITYDTGENALNGAFFVLEVGNFQG